MVTIINDPYAHGKGAPIGAAIGQGLSQQLPQEIQRQRLAGSLEDIAKSGQQANPLQQAAALLRQGANLQEISQYLPLIQQQQQWQAFMDQKRQSDNQKELEKIQGMQGQPISLEIKGRMQQPVGSEGETIGELPLGQQIRGANFLEPLTPEQLEDQARKLVRERKFIDPYKALKYAEKQDDKRLAGDTAFQAKQDLTEKTFNDILQQKLQKGPNNTFEDLSGDLQRKLLNRAQTDVAKGGNPKQVANKYAQEALRLAQAHANMQKEGKSHWFQTNPSTARKHLEEIRDIYKKSGGLEEYANELESTNNLTTHYARNVAFPLSKDVNNTIAREKGRLGGRGIGSRSREIALADEIGKNITNDDSLFTIGLQAYRKGLDDRFIIDYISKNYKDNLNFRQIEELTDYVPVSPSFSDIWMYTMTGMDPLQELK